MMKRLLYVVTCGLMLAIIVHISIILMIPVLSEKDAAKQISSQFAPGSFNLIRDGNSIGISNMDPYIKMSVCNFDLENNAVEIEGPPTNTFWSASVFDQRGRVIYSMNDRTAINGVLKVLIVNPIQMADIRQTQPEEIETAILVEASENKGFVLVRALVPDASWNDEINGFLNSSQCKTYDTGRFASNQS